MVASHSRSSRQKVQFFRRPEDGGNYCYYRPKGAHHPLRSSRLYVSGGKAKVADAASGEGNKVCETADAPASFKSGVWKRFACFPVSRKEKRSRARANTHLRHFLRIL